MRSQDQVHHEAFEWVMKDDTPIIGRSIEEVFEKLPETFFKDSKASVKSKIKQALKMHAVSLDESIPSDNGSAMAMFFRKLEDADVGSWRFFEFLIGGKWRFDASRNAVVRRKTRDTRKQLSIETLEKLKANLQKANDSKTEETFDKISRANKGKKLSEEHKKSIGIKMLQVHQARSREAEIERRRKISETKRRNFEMKQKILAEIDAIENAKSNEP